MHRTAEASGADRVREGLGQVDDPVALLEGFFAYAPVGLQIYRADGHCLVTNQAFRDLFGIEPPPHYNVLRDDVVARRGLLGLVQRAFAGETVQFPTFWYHPRELDQVKVTPGRRVAVSASFFPLFGRHGVVDYVAGVYKDDTVAVLARQRVEASERLLRQVIENTADLVFVKDQDGRYEVANPASARVAGHSVDEIIGRTDDEVFPPQAAEALRAVDRRILARGLPETYDESFVVDGNVRHFSTAKTARRDAEGRVNGVIGICRDITERKLGEEALAALAEENEGLLLRARAEEQWLGAILESTPMPLIFVEPGTARVFFANAAADRMAGGSLARPADAEAYARLYDMRDLDGRALSVDESPLVRAARGERLSGDQVRWHFPTGEKVVAMHSLRLAAVHGHPETVLVAFDDITALKGVQTALEEAVRARQDFLSIAGHELKTPLTSLLLIEQGLDRTLSLGGEGKVADRWRSLRRQTRRLGTLVDQLLDVSRLSAGKLILEEERLDLVGLAREVVTRFAPEVAPIVVEAPAAVPGRWDPLRLEQVITNLVSNALKYGQGRPVTIRIESDARTATLAVRDQGIGIAPDARTRIFDRFERATPVNHTAGLGLGLWIVRQIVEAMGGTIGVESELGKGSAFTLRLPRGD